MKLRRFSGACLFILLAASGCSSTSVNDHNEYRGADLARPGRILVYNFTANPAEVPPESEFSATHAVQQSAPSVQELDMTAGLGAEVARQVVAQLDDAGLPAVLAAGQLAPQVNDIMIRGFFVSADEGSVTKRMLVGFGSGNAELTTAVEGFQMTAHGPRLLGSGTVDTAGGKTPGVILPVAVMAVTSNPIGLAVGGTMKLAGEATGSATMDGAAERTADEISAQLIAAAKKQGWI